MLKKTLKIIFKFVLKQQRSFVRLQGKWSFIKAYGNALAYGGEIKIKKNNLFEVPFKTGCCKEKIKIGSNNRFGYYFALCIGNGEIMMQTRKKEAEINIGNNCFFSNNINLISMCSISIGDDFLCGDSVTIFDSDFHQVSPELRKVEQPSSKAVKIGNNVWLGSRVMICKGVNIGDDSVVAAGSIVTKDVPPRTLVGGIPAKVLRDL